MALVRRLLRSTVSRGLVAALAATLSLGPAAATAAPHERERQPLSPVAIATSASDCYGRGEGYKARWYYPAPPRQSAPLRCGDSV